MAEPIPPNENGPEQPSRPRKLSRRGFFRLGVGTITATATADLANSQLIQPPIQAESEQKKQEEEREKTLNELRKKAREEAMYNQHLYQPAFQQESTR